MKYLVISHVYQVSGREAEVTLCQNTESGEIAMRQYFEMFGWEEMLFDSPLKALEAVRQWFKANSWADDDRQFVIDRTDDTYHVFCVHTSGDDKDFGGRTSVKIIRDGSNYET